MLVDELKSLINGEVNNDDTTLQTYSRDASIFELKPQLVISPQDSQDICQLVNYINTHPKENITITPRAAGTCMSGGSLSESVVLDMTKHFNKVIEVKDSSITTQPGVFYRDFEKETLKRNLLLPCYTSSRELNTVGGMVGNNSAGEKSLSFGQTERYVKKLKAVLSDGNEYTFTPLSKEELDKKTTQKDFEGKLYKRVFNLIKNNEELIKKSEPKTTKNSAGYLIWKVWNGETFDMTKLLTGSQGTLGVITEIEFNLIKPKSHSALLVISLYDITHLDQVVNEVLKFTPESFECYDNQTLKYAVKFLGEIVKDFKQIHGLRAYAQFVPELLQSITGRFPKLVLLAEFTGESEDEVIKLAKQAQLGIQKLNLRSKVVHIPDTEKYWIIRRDSFGLLKQHAVHAKACPFIDDIVVNPQVLPEFLPKLNKIFAEYKLVLTIAGHIGNGNFHVIPLMDLSDEHVRSTIPEVSKKVFDLVFEYGGSMAAEHNDGLVRGPYLQQMFGEDMYQIFKEIKAIFDPNGIFNPHKKSDATFEYSLNHILKKN